MIDDSGDFVSPEGIIEWGLAARVAAGYAEADSRTLLQSVVTSGSSVARDAYYAARGDDVVPDTARSAEICAAVVAAVQSWAVGL